MRSKRLAKSLLGVTVTLGAMLSVDAGQSDPKTQAARLEGHVRALTAIEPPRNFFHPAGLDKAARYIASELEASGWTVDEQTFEVDGNTYRNLRALRGPEDAPRVVVGAHYDVHGDLPGADDNASGVAVLIELARTLGEYRPDIGLELVAVTLEEQPAFSRDIMGSAQHAELLAEQGVEVKLMMSLEMLGYYRDEPDSQVYPVPGMQLIYGDTGDFVGLVGRLQEAFDLWRLAGAMRPQTEVPVRMLASPVTLPGIASSDHRNYWAQGWPAIMVTDTAYYRNPNYHRSSDTPDTLDYRRMSALVPGLAAGVRALTGPSSR